MLKKTNFKNQITISVIFFVMTLTLFSIGHYGFLQNPFVWPVFINYSIVSLVVSAYLFVIMHKIYNYAFLLYIAGYVFAFAIYLYNSTKDYTGFLEIVGIISWFVIMILVIALGLSFELLLKSRQQNKELKALAKEQEIRDKEAQAQIDIIDADYEISHEEDIEETNQNEN